MVLARSHDARVLVECKGDVGLEGQAGVFQDDLGGMFVSHSQHFMRLGSFRMLCISAGSSQMIKPFDEIIHRVKWYISIPVHPFLFARTSGYYRRT